MSRGSKVLAVTVIGASMTALDTTIVNVARDTLVAGVPQFGIGGVVGLVGLQHRVRRGDC